MEGWIVLDIQRGDFTNVLNREYATPLLARNALWDGEPTRATAITEERQADGKNL